MFLDVQMPEVDGFARRRRRSPPSSNPAPLPAVIFVTAHDEYALRAFDSHAIDYLLKPFSDERFQAALDRVIRHVKAGHAHALMSQMQALMGAGRGDSPPETPHQPRPADRAAPSSIASSSRANIGCGCCRSSRSAGSKRTGCT